MVKLEEIKPGAYIKGLSPNGVSKIVNVEWHGEHALTVFYKDENGKVNDQIVFSHDLSQLEVVHKGLPWSFDADGQHFRMVSEAYRIRLAHLFDPYLAVHTSTVQPLPHQISAVYGEMLPRLPLRFLLADDPGAGKTIMSGLLIKELLIRGDLERCLIVAPGSLVEQWQDELDQKFELNFEILSRQDFEVSNSGNPFNEKNHLIARLDVLSRNEEALQKLLASEPWDLIICDEAHKMSANLFGNEVKKTKRYQLGESLSKHCRHFLLMTATPHNGKEADFQLFMALLDGDRFEGRFRDGVHKSDASDMMRRLTKEELVTFEGKPLFPERIATTVQYELSPLETILYNDVTTYVREEMNRADMIGEKQRRLNVGFALQVLQRRLASSPESIYNSIKRRIDRLESRLREERMAARGEKLKQDTIVGIPIDYFEEQDDEELNAQEREEFEQTIVDQATAAQTVEELELEIQTLKGLMEQAKRVVMAGEDTKWVKLNEILDAPEMVDSKGNRRKLIIFSEFRDTLYYLQKRISNRLGNPDNVVMIHGGVSRENRRHVIEEFNYNPDVLVLLANDAAGEGVNLQRAHLMVNYDLPWNPNRLEQRFGRIHRIGQKEVCHVWNLIAANTREGDVYFRLLTKLDEERKALGGRVFDVLGQLFEERPLRELLMEAIRYGERSDIKDRLNQVIDNNVGRENLLAIIKQRALVKETMSVAEVHEIREKMQRADALRLQPHFIQGFFQESYEHLGGQIFEREQGRFQLKHIPAVIREKDRQIGTRHAIAKAYERIAFDKTFVNEPTHAAFICPGHPLLDAVISLIRERYSTLLKQGSILIDENDLDDQPRLLFYLQVAIQDGRTNHRGERRVVQQRLEFLELLPDGSIIPAGPAPYLDFRPIEAAEKAAISDVLEADWLMQEALDKQIISHAIAKVIPSFLEEVKLDRLHYIDKIEEEVRKRMKREINWWDQRAIELREQEQAGKTNAKLNSQQASQRAETLEIRWKRRQDELANERQITAVPPQIVGGALIIPKGLLLQRMGQAVEEEMSVDYGPLGRKTIENAAMQAVMEAERRLGREPHDVSDKKIGYDILSKDLQEGSLYFIEVKGRWHEGQTVTLTHNEIYVAKNKKETHRLAIVQVDHDGARPARYVSNFDFGESGLHEVNRSFNLAKLLEGSREPF